MILLGIAITYILSNIVFNIEIIHSQKNIRELVQKELTKNGITKYRFKKNNEELRKIEGNILKENKETLEWIEILVNGTKYTIKVQERITNNKKDNNKIRDIVAAKNATITKINAINGEKVKNLNAYTHKGDTIITGVITHSNGEITYTPAEGEVYGDVWYILEIEYPYIHNNIKLTGKKDNTIAIKILNKNYYIFNKNKFKTYNHKDYTIINNNIIPISIIKQKREETIITETIYTEDEALNEAISLGTKKLLEYNKKINKTNKTHIITKEANDNTIKLKLFISVNENITQYKNLNIEN